MKLKAKIKSILLARSGTAALKHRSHSSTSTATTTVTTTTATCTSVATLTASPATMPRDYPSSSKSMMDLNSPTSSEDSHKNLHKARSVWDVTAMDGFRRRILPGGLHSRPPLDRGRNFHTRPVSLPSSSSAGEAQSRPKKFSTVQFADKVGNDADERIRSVSAIALPTSRATLSSGSSSVSTHLLHDPASSVRTESESDVFMSDCGLKEAQSMRSLAPPRGSSNSSEEDAKGRRKRSSVSHALKSLSRSTPAMSPSASPRHSDSEGQLRVSKGTKKFMRHFAEAPPSEWVLNYFSCALVSDILLQGTLYITQNYFAFYSKIFGHVSRLLIPVTQVASLQKERTAKIIPNAVGLQMLDGKNYVFGSLLSRDSTYKLMLHIWRKAQRMADSDSEPPSGVQVAAEDDGEDSVSGSANSLMTEDQADGGYLVSTAVNSLTGVPSPIPTSPWTPEEVNTTTNATNIYNTENTTLPPGNCIPVNSLTSASDTIILPGGVLMTGKVCTHEEPSSKTSAAASDGKASTTINILEWFTQGSIVKTCFKVGSVPMKLVGEGVKELWSLPRTSLLLLISTLLLLLLFASAAFMLHRVDLLSQQVGLEKYGEYDSMYEEVLQMQQRLHSAASTEIEKTLSLQLKHIATVRQSLEALMVLFNKDFQIPLETAQIPDNT
ncbi:putative membrane protein C20F10.07 [Chionoecetes opilio]|uniref:Putative membrane protein C20F10.07 n=1 Tax=Chionoecetes opilio TaxID=41210 RepID=A0A8J4Y5V2_CHIOP|nr:putative membrane protein C20F10.07 [Chionoecetes opilio]